MEQIQQTAAVVSDSIGTLVAPLGNLWGADGSKSTEKKHTVPTFGLFGEQSTKKNTKDTPVWINEFGPGGAVGIGCGAGIGFAFIGGAGVGSAPWNAIRPVFGIGICCGVGVGYGYGLGLGTRWDKRVKKKDPSKRVVIEI
jgi:hypothetical protein